jgi:ubiquinone biosynthesis protein
MIFVHRPIHIRRYREIARVLTRHGLGFLIGIVGLEGVAPFRRGVAVPSGRTRQPVRLRRALEDLGPTFIKLGQILSTRPDLLPPEYQHELAKLQDSAPPFPFEDIENILIEELGRGPDEVFARFEREPLASASIGQVHAATLHSGIDVVVKVRRPGVAEVIEQDLDILYALAQTASRRWEVAHRYDVVGLVLEFSDTLRGEVDYLREARNAERLREAFVGDEHVRIPRVFRETTTDRVITLERMRGVKISDVEGLRSQATGTKPLAERIFRMYLKMIFEDGFFHADPHPGNFFIDRCGRIGLVDFGMVGHVDDRLQDDLVRLIMAIAMEDPERLVDVILDLGVARARVERTMLRQDLQRLLNRYSDRALGEIEIGPVIEDGLSIVRRHNLQLPSNMALLLKTTIMAEGLAANVNPEFEPMGVLRPYTEHLIIRQLSPSEISRRLGQAGYEAAQLGMDLPHILRRILSAVDRGQIEVGVRPERFDPLMHRAEQLVNRVVLGIITASFIIGLAILTAVYSPPGWERFAGVAFAMRFVLAGSLGLYLAWTILRSSR